MTDLISCLAQVFSVQLYCLLFYCCYIISILTDLLLVCVGSNNDEINEFFRDNLNSVSSTFKINIQFTQRGSDIVIKVTSTLAGVRGQ